MSKARLKKTLNELSKEQIIEMVTEMYDARKEAKDYLEYWLDPDGDKELEKREVMIRRLFFTTSDRPRKLPSVSDIKKIVKDFTTICFDSEKTAQLLLYVCDSYAAWMKVKRFGRTASAAAQRSVETAAAYIESTEQQEHFGIRLDNVRNLINQLIKQELEAPVLRRRGFGLWGW